MFFSQSPRGEDGLNLAKISLRWLLELPGQKPALPGRQAVPEQELYGVVEIKEENDYAILQGNSRPVKQSLH